MGCCVNDESHFKIDKIIGPFWLSLKIIKSLYTINWIWMIIRFIEDIIGYVSVKFSVTEWYLTRFFNLTNRIFIGFPLLDNREPGLKTIMTVKQNTRLYKQRLFPVGAKTMVVYVDCKTKNIFSGECRVVRYRWECGKLKKNEWNTRRQWQRRTVDNRCCYCLWDHRARPFPHTRWHDNDISVGYTRYRLFLFNIGKCSN